MFEVQIAVWIQFGDWGSGTSIGDALRRFAQIRAL